MKFEILTDQRIIKKGSKGKGLHLAKKADEKIKHCLTCKQCYEWDYLSKQYSYYDDFPTYGKAKEDCPKCSA